jgi:hypothetical protein
MKALRAAAVVVCMALASSASPALAQDAAGLRAKAEGFRGALADNVFHRPLVLESTEADSDLRGDVYAIVNQPFDVLETALHGAAQWCDLLILHLNVKNCGVSGAAPAELLALTVGRKVEQAADDGYRIEFRFRVAAVAKDYLRVQMNADAGPLGTRNYRLAFEAAPLDAARTVVHLSYAYAYGLAARMATQTYLATLGRGKVGFSVASTGADGKPVYIGGVRGVLERNTMRYYLAIEAYLDALGVPAAQQAEKRLRDWFAATERYPRQLHELDADEYFAMKRHDLERQRGSAGSKSD